MSGPRHLSTYLNNTRCVITEMLENRGMTYRQLRLLRHLLVLMIWNQCLLNCQKKTRKSFKFIMKYLKHEQITNNLPKELNTLSKNIKNPNDKTKDLTIVFIVCDGMTPSVKEAVRLLSAKYNVFIQIFPIRNLMYNVTKHKAVPRHIRIPKTEYTSYLNEFLDSLHIESLDKLLRSLIQIQLLCLLDYVQEKCVKLFVQV